MTQHSPVYCVATFGMPKVSLSEMTNIVCSSGSSLPSTACREQHKSMITLEYARSLPPPAPGRGQQGGLGDNTPHGNTPPPSARFSCSILPGGGTQGKQMVQARCVAQHSDQVPPLAKRWCGSLALKGQTPFVGSAALPKHYMDFRRGIGCSRVPDSNEARNVAPRVAVVHCFGVDVGGLALGLFILKLDLRALELLVKSTTQAMHGAVSGYA